MTLPLFSAKSRNGVLYGDSPEMTAMSVAVIASLRSANHSGLRCGALMNSNLLLTSPPLSALPRQGASSP